MLGDEPRLYVEQLGAHPVYLACRPGHPLTERQDLTLERVLSFPLVSSLIRRDAALTAAAGGALGRMDPDTGDFAPAIQVNSVAIARQVARETDALCPGAIAMLAPDLDAGRLVRLDFHVAAMRATYALMYLRHRTLAPAARVFLDLLRAVEPEMAETGPRTGARTTRGRQRPLRQMNARRARNH